MNFDESHQTCNYRKIESDWVFDVKLTFFIFTKPQHGIQSGFINFQLIEKKLLLLSCIVLAVSEKLTDLY